MRYPSPADFLTVPPETELRGRGVEADPGQVEAELRARDTQDSSRAAAPLRPAADALLLDTTALDAEAAFAAALRLVRARLAEAGAPLSA